MMWPPRALVLSWAGLMGLLAFTVTLAYQPLGGFNAPVALMIATAKALVVAAIFMELRERGGLTIAFAGAGFCWLAILLWLAWNDFATRPQFPPAPPGVEIGNGTERPR
jgi:cytochrome c oxidase subunit IV